MPSPPLEVPQPKYDDQSAKDQLVLVVERVVYMLKWIAANPTGLIDGRHQQNLKNALAELDAALSSNEWQYAIQNAKKLDEIGLTSQQLVLKLGIFNHLFERFLDMTAKRGSKDHELLAEHIDDFKRRVLPWYRRMFHDAEVASRALEAGSTIVMSIAQITGIENKLEGVKEISEMVCQGLSASAAKH